jgi:hypothetical protein
MIWPSSSCSRVGAVAVQHAGAAAGQRGGVLVGGDAMAGRLDADQAHALVGQERMEQADGVGTAADAGDHRVGKTSFDLEDLLAGFGPDHRLEVADHHRIGVRAGGGADQVIGVVHVGDPIAHRLVHGVLQGAGARGHGADFRPQQVHAEDVGLLTLDVGGAHIDDARQAEAGADGGGGHAVLAGAGLGDDPGLAHAHGQQDLAQGVVDLVRAGVVQLVALEIDLGPAEVLGQPLGEIERAGPAGIVGVEAGQLAWNAGSALAAA